MGILNMLSPGIQVNEVDLTTIVPGASTSVGAYVGEFTWGPCNQPTLISDEIQLVNVFGRPTSNLINSFLATSFFSCANFLAYTNSLYVVRSIDSNTAKNAQVSANANVSVLIKNVDEFETNYLNVNSANTYGEFVAKYPGSVGNSLKVSVCANSATFATWEYRKLFDSAPGTSQYIQDARNNPSANDELHIIVVDEDGIFSGKSGTILERWPNLSKAVDCIDIDGLSSYYKRRLMGSSNYIYAIDPISYANSSATWGNHSQDVSSYFSPANNYTVSLTNGSNGGIAPDSALQTSWDSFRNKDRYEISLAFMGASNIVVSQYVLDNIILGSDSETPIIGRKDTMLFVSPRIEDVVNQSGSEVDNIVTDIESFVNVFNRYSSYLVVDSGWKYQFDKYNNVYRWIPLNADIAGICAYTDDVADTWYSPGGYSRGKLKNVVKLAWSPDQTQRDALYKAGINPVITQVGEGTLLLGDKTMQKKPSAFDRINVRRLFITLEKVISRAAKYSLFEYNDAFTRAQFVATVEPYLRTVQGRRGITDYKVVCDESNNTPEIIDRNGFVGDIYIKPARSINFIQLNFVAVKTGVEFTTVVGNF